jgi:hypothetical protein
VSALRTRLEAKRAQLVAELRQGQQLLADLDRKRGLVITTLDRTDGALKLVQDLLEEEKKAEAEAAP